MTWLGLGLGLGLGFGFGRVRVRVWIRVRVNPHLGDACGGAARVAPGQGVIVPVVAPG